jgi:hypothetical protein
LPESGRQTGEPDNLRTEAAVTKTSHMDGIVLLPGLLSAYVTWRYSLLQAFLNVYLPTLLLLPDYYRWQITTHLTFGEAAILPIGVAFAFTLLPRWRFSITDFAVLAVIATMAASEFASAGYHDAQNFTLNLLLMCGLPYMLAKGLIEPFGLGIQFSKRIVVLLCIVVVLSLYEFRFGTDPFRDIFQPFFPDQKSVWDTQLRWGFARIAGPYGTAILASILFIVALLLHHWLVYQRAWDSVTRFDLGIPPRVKPYLIGGILLMGIAFTMSRGPWLSLLLAACIARIGWATNLKRTFLFGVSGVVIVGGLLVFGVLQYASVGRSAAGTAEQETAAYRKELIDKYMVIAESGGLLGYGRFNWPKVSGMPSIDNYYLLLTLMHGPAGLALFVLLLLCAVIRLSRHAFRMQHLSRDEVMKSFTLLACILTIAISVVTVYMDMQVMVLLYLLIGWGEGCVVQGTVARRAVVPNDQMQFRHVLS